MPLFILAYNILSNAVYLSLVFAGIKCNNRSFKTQIVQPIDSGSITNLNIAMLVADLGLQVSSRWRYPTKPCI